MPAILDYGAANLVIVLNAEERLKDSDTPMDFSLPFLMAGSNWPKDLLTDHVGLKNNVDDFIGAFTASAERVTDGRAAMPVKEEFTPLLLTKIKSFLEKTIVLSPSDQTGAGDVPHASLAKMMKVTMYSIAAGNVSPAKFELGELRCIRVGLHCGFCLGNGEGE